MYFALYEMDNAISNKGRVGGVAREEGKEKIYSLKIQVVYPLMHL